MGPPAAQANRNFMSAASGPPSKRKLGESVIVDDHLSAYMALPLLLLVVSWAWMPGVPTRSLPTERSDVTAVP